MRHKKDLIDIEELSAECRERGIKNHKEYLEAYKGIGGAPSNLARSYGPKYEGWEPFIRIGCQSEDPKRLRELGIFHY